MVHEVLYNGDTVGYLINSKEGIQCYSKREVDNCNKLIKLVKDKTIRGFEYNEENAPEMVMALLGNQPTDRDIQVANMLRNPKAHYIVYSGNSPTVCMVDIDGELLGMHEFYNRFKSEFHFYNQTVFYEGERYDIAQCDFIKNNFQLEPFDYDVYDINNFLNKLFKL